MRPSPRSSSALFVLLALGACGRSTRKPISRSDGGPPVVVVDRRVEPETLGPRSPELEPNDTVAQAQPLDAGARIAGALAASGKDVDLYQLRPPGIAGGVDLGGADAGAAPGLLGFVSVTPTEGAVVLQLVDGKGKTILSRTAPLGRKVTLSYLRLDPASGAVVRVRLPSLKTALAGDVAYTLEYTARTVAVDEDPTPEVEPNDQPAQAISLPSRGNLTGRLDGNDDRDLVLLPAEPEGTTFRVELAAIAELALEVRLRNGQDAISVARGGKGGELRLRNLPSSPQPLHLQLRAVDGSSDTPYTLRVSTEPPLADAAIEHEPNDTVARANPLTPGESVAGHLWPGDVDMYCAKEGLVFGARVEGLPDVSLKLELTDAAGKTLQKAEPGKRGAAAELTPAPEVRCVRLSARSRDTAFDTPYRLTFTQ